MLSPLSTLVARRSPARRWLLPGRLAVGATLLAATVNVGCSELIGAEFDSYIDRQEKHFSVTGVLSLDVSTFDGPVTVRSSDAAEILIQVERRAGTPGELKDIDVSFKHEGNRLTVAARDLHQRAHLWHDQKSAAITVSVPSSAVDLAIKSGDGSITLSDVTGHFDLRTADGAIRADRLTGDVKAQSGDGTIGLRSITGSIDAHTGDGRVVATGRLSGVRVRTNDGSVTVRADDGSAPTADWDISSGDGSVTLELPPEFNAKVEAHSNDGQVHMRDGVGHAQTHGSDRFHEHSIDRQFGTGGRTIRLRTADGSISVRRF